MTETGRTQVGIALIARDGAYLIRQRPARGNSPMPGVWEFPGGKVEPGETPATATARECLEEVGVAIEVGPLDRRTAFDYPHGAVELFYFHARLLHPSAEPAPDTGFRWVRAADLPSYTFPPANEPLIADLAAGLAPAEG